MNLTKLLAVVVFFVTSSSAAYAQFAGSQDTAGVTFMQSEFLLDPGVLEGEWEGQFHCDSDPNKGKGIYKLSVFSIGGNYKALIQWSRSGNNLSEQLMEFRVLSPTLVRFGSDLVGHLDSADRLFLHGTSVEIASSDFCNLRILVRR